MAMAMASSVTVSIGEDTMGVEMRRLRVTLVERSTWRERWGGECFFFSPPVARVRSRRASRVETEKKNSVLAFFPSQAPFL